MSNTRCELLARDSAYNVSFTLNQTIIHFHNKKTSTINRLTPYYDTAKNVFYTIYFTEKKNFIFVCNLDTIFSKKCLIRASGTKLLREARELHLHEY